MLIIMLYKKIQIFIKSGRDFGFKLFLFIQMAKLSETRAGHLKSARGSHAARGTHVEQHCSSLEPPDSYRTLVGKSCPTSVR